MANEELKPTPLNEEAPITPESAASNTEQDNNSENISDEQAQKLGSAALETAAVQGEDEEKTAEDIYDEVSENKVITADNARKWHELGEDVDELLEARTYYEVTSSDLRAVIDAGFSADEVADCFDEQDFDNNGLLDELVNQYGADKQRIADRLYKKLQNSYGFYGDAKEMNAGNMATVLDELKKLGADIDYDNARRMIDKNISLDQGEDEEEDDDNDENDLDEDSKKFYESQEWINDGWD